MAEGLCYLALGVPAGLTLFNDVFNAVCDNYATARRD